MKEKIMTITIWFDKETGTVSSKVESPLPEEVRKQLVKEFAEHYLKENENE